MARYGGTNLFKLEIIISTAFVSLIIITGIFSYNAGLWDGKIELCEAQDSYYVQTHEGWVCMDKLLVENKLEIKDGKFQEKKEFIINEGGLNISP